jgi:uncharacterized transporter YbjL
MQMPLGASQLVFLVLTTTVATFSRNTRVAMMILNTTVSLIGMVLVWKLDESHAEARVAGLALTVAFAANTPLSLSLISSNVAGLTKRSLTSAFIFIGYCVGNIAGPQFFYEREEPHYQVSHLSLVTPSIPSTLLTLPALHSLNHDQTSNVLYRPE